MESLIKLQLDCQKAINKCKINFKKAGKDRLSVSYIETRLEALDQQWLTFCETHRQIITDFSSDEIGKSLYDKENVYETTEELYFDYKTLLKEGLGKFTSVSNITTDEVPRSGNNKMCMNLKLPKISIPVFSGLYTEWTTFRDLFVSLIHNNSTLDDVQKMHYLKSFLTGEADKLLRHVPIAESNYKRCWEQLKHRYDNKKYLSDNILKRFMSIKPLQVESSSAIKDVLDTTNECLHALQNLGIDTSTWDVIVIHIVSQKLDSESRKLWEAKASEDFDKFPTLAIFNDFLEHRFRALEFLSPKAGKSVMVHNSSLNNDLQVQNSFHSLAISFCPFCNENHKIYNCRSFSKIEVESRREFVQTNGLCFNCLGPNHSVYTCRQPSRCRVCKRKHHSLLHPKSVIKSSPSSDDRENGSEEPRVAVSVATTEHEDNGSIHESNKVVTYFSKAGSQVLLATALVKTNYSSGCTETLRCLLDQGSEASFITESTVQALGLKKVSNKVSIAGIGSGPDDDGTLMSKHVVFVKIQSLHNPEVSLVVKAHVMRNLTTVIPSARVSLKSWPQLKQIKLADPQFCTPNRIDMLLGAEVYGQILDEGVIKGPPGCPVAQNTKLGWILSGQIQSESSEDSAKCHNIVSMHTQVSESDILKKFWELEAEPSDSTVRCLTDEERSCEEIFSTTYTRDDTGRYVVKLPFKTNDPQCKYGNTQTIAGKRLRMLEKRFDKNPILKQRYSEVIEEYITLGHMEVVPADQRDRPGSVYLPHHAVVREDKTTSKVRVVFDASCPGDNGVSLNSELMVGPSLQPDLRHIVMQWRTHPICIIADIVKMYRQIKVTDSDADFQRILWRDGNSLQHLRILRVTFGTASAPYLAVKALQQLAKDEGDRFPLAAVRVLSHFYMDDLMSGCETVSEGVQIFEELNSLLVKGGFQLQKWKTNNEELLKYMGKRNDTVEERLEIKSEYKEDNIQRVLGLAWNSTADYFEYSVKLPTLSEPVTKRKVISDISRLFDPLGWIAPTIITAKIFIQKLWMSGIEWDQELPPSLYQEWIKYRDSLLLISGFRIPRWIHTRSHDRSRELHGFCDASNAAYAAVVYLRVIDADGKVHINLIASKTRVAPIKQVSIPRLELCGAVILAKLLKEVSEVLEVPKDFIHAWTDSSVVLAWLSSHPSRWKTFIGNRVSTILSTLDRNQWSHVRSSDNPADSASRGIVSPNDYDLQLWTEGPGWLKNETVKYSPLDKQDTNLEERSKKVCCVAVEEDEQFWERFSKLRRLGRVTAICKRFYEMTHHPGTKFPVWLTCAEIQDALNICIKYYQGLHFRDEISSIEKEKIVSKKSKIASLNPFIDSYGILRVGGRLDKANICETMKHPILIPKSSHLTNLIIADAHERMLHGGTQMIMNHLRTKYWIIDMKRQVKLYNRRCVRCIRYSSRATNQLMGQLPLERSTPSRPFYRSGVDYAGPIAVRSTKGRGQHATKGYICLFVCMVTRAVHLEVVSDLTSEAFIAAFKRFVARRGHCGELWSDNGTNFVGASRELQNLFANERSAINVEIADWLSTNGTNWHFIPPHSPNFGGLWEAGVKSTKHHLKRVIGESRLTFEEMTTVLSQIEACLNSRPIAQGSDVHPLEPYPLTPGHFLIGEPVMLVPDLNYTESNISNLRRWHLTQRMVQDFWRRWSGEYLAQFFQRYKWNREIDEPQIGDVVLVMEDDLPPGRWLYGVIVEKHPGSDNLTRVVSLRCKGSNVIKRPLSKIRVLPITD